MRYGLMLVASVVLLLAACDSDESGGPSGDGVFMELLRLVPDDPVYRRALFMGDVQGTREILGIDLPSGEYDEAAVEELVQQLAEPELEGFRGAEPRFFIGVDNEHALTLSATAQGALGISILDVDQWVMSGDALQVHAIRGSFDLDGIQETLEACTECPPPATEEYRGWPVYGWGDDFEHDIPRRFQPPLFDHLGRGGRLALSPELIARTLSTDNARAIVDAYEGDGSLADDDAYRSAVAGLEGMGALALSISIMTRGNDFAPPSLGLQEIWTVREGDTVLVPYELWGIGPGWDEGPYTAVVLVHGSEEDAEENGRRFADRVASTRMLEDGAVDGTPMNFSDHVTDIDVTVDGRVLRARIDGYAMGPNEVMWSLPLLKHE